MESNLTLRRIWWSLYLTLVIITQTGYIVLLSILGNEADFGRYGPAISLLAASLLLSIIFFLILILTYQYRARYILWLLVPFIGGLGFAIYALVSKVEPEELRITGKWLAFLSLLGLWLLDQTTGSFFQIFIGKDRLEPWEIVIDLILFALTITYFIYWTKEKRKLVDWSIKNLWPGKWWILLSLVGMFVAFVALNFILHYFQLGAPKGSNQETIEGLLEKLPFALIWVHLAIGAPIMEEVVFRTGIFELMSPKHPRLALGLSTLIFAGIHLDGAGYLDWRIWAPYLILSFFLSFLYYKTRKLETTVFVHFIWNGLISIFLP